MELNNEPIYKASQSKVSTVVAYLIGAKEDMFSYYSGDSMDIIEKLKKNDDAIILRSLCNIRTNLMLHYQSTQPPGMRNARLRPLRRRSPLPATARLSPSPWAQPSQAARWFLRRAPVIAGRCPDRSSCRSRETPRPQREHRLCGRGRASGRKRRDERHRSPSSGTTMQSVVVRPFFMETVTGLPGTVFEAAAKRSMLVPPLHQRSHPTCTALGSRCRRWFHVTT